MADYKRMYLSLYATLIKISKDIEEAQSLVEDIYLESTEEPIKLEIVRNKKNKTDKPK